MNPLIQNIFLYKMVSNLSLFVKINYLLSVITESNDLVVGLLFSFQNWSYIDWFYCFMTWMFELRQNDQSTVYFHLSLTCQGVCWNICSWRDFNFLKVFVPKFTQNVINLWISINKLTGSWVFIELPPFLKPRPFLYVFWKLFAFVTFKHSTGEW